MPRVEAGSDSISSSASKVVMKRSFVCSSGVSEGGFLTEKRSKKHLKYMSSLVAFSVGDSADTTGCSTRCHAGLCDRGSF